MIRKIKIDKLFGRFNYVIEVDRAITIITGPNGFGKSTILRIIDSLSRGEYSFFSKLDFAGLVVSFDNGEETVIKKTKKGVSFDGIVMPDVVEHKRPQWVLTQNGQYQAADVLYGDNGIYFSPYFDLASSESSKKQTERRKKLDQVKALCGEVRFISEQRLIRTENKQADSAKAIDVIRELPRSLQAEISKVSSEYSKVANQLDSTYPNRLFAAKDGVKDAEEYQALLTDANEKFTKLNHYNLVDMSIITEEEYKPNYSTALKIYFDDFAVKYKVFEQLLTKLDLFTSIINSRLTFKTIKITRDEGFLVVDEDGKNLSLSQLSSGEKQEIVLFYELIFNTKKELLLLIDEPEISLHISWQKMFLDDLQAISQQVGLQVIVATHSPQVVSNHFDIQIDLGELYGRQLDSAKS